MGRFKKNLSKLLRTGILAGSLLLPNLSFGNPENINLVNRIKPTEGYDFGDGLETTLGMNRRSGATDDYDGIPYDQIYTYSPPMATWKPKPFTRIDGNDLRLETKHLDSLTDFNFNLAIVFQGAESIEGQSVLRLRNGTNSVYNALSPQMHYTISYAHKPEYFVEGGMPITDTKNVRDLCPEPNVFFYWTLEGEVGDGDGTKINVPASDADANGQVVFGTGILRREWNQLVSTKEGNGTASFEGSEILDYGADREIILNAGPGNYINHYILDRSGNERQRIVTTNNVGSASTDVSLENLVGSNSLHVVYSPLEYNLSLTSSYSPWFNTSTNVGNPEGAGTYTHGSDAEISIDKYVPHSENPGRRLRFKEFTEDE
jgi:hypothetical protein